MSVTPVHHRSPRVGSRLLGLGIVVLLALLASGVLSTTAFASGDGRGHHGSAGDGGGPAWGSDGHEGHGNDGGHGHDGGDEGDGQDEPPVVVDEVPMVVLPVIAVELPAIVVPGLPGEPPTPMPPAPSPGPVGAGEPGAEGVPIAESVAVVPLRFVAQATADSLAGLGVEEADRTAGEPERAGESPSSTAVVPAGVDPPLAPFVPGGGIGWGIVAALAAAAAAGFVVRHATLRGAIRDAQRSATRDPLTGLPNRRLFDEILARELVRGRRRAVPLALLLIDLDGFKRVNDTRGHAAGDEVLRTVAETLTGRVRGSDLPARLGGDEFAVVLPECGPADARRIAEELRDQIGQAVGPTVTASVGVAGAPDHGVEAEGLLAAADAALYRAKADGRDRVVVAEPGTTPTR